MSVPLHRPMSSFLEIDKLPFKNIFFSSTLHYHFLLLRNSRGGGGGNSFEGVSSEILIINFICPWCMLDAPSLPSLFLCFRIIDIFLISFTLVDGDFSSPLSCPCFREDWWFACFTGNSRLRFNILDIEGLCIGN